MSETISIRDRTFEQFDELPNNHASFDSFPIVKIEKFDEILNQDRVQKRIVQSDRLEQVCNQKRLKFMFPRSLTPDEEVEEVLSTRTLKKSCPIVGTGDLSYPYWHVDTDDEKNRRDVAVRQIVCASRDEETWSIPVGGILLTLGVTLLRLRYMIYAWRT